MYDNAYLCTTTHTYVRQRILMYDNTYLCTITHTYVRQRFIMKDKIEIVEFSITYPTKSCFDNKSFYNLASYTLSKTDKIISLKAGVFYDTNKTLRYKKILVTLSNILQTARIHTFSPEGGKSIKITRPKYNKLNTRFANIINFYLPMLTDKPVHSAEYNDFIQQTWYKSQHEVYPWIMKI